LINSREKKRNSFSYQEYSNLGLLLIITKCSKNDNSKSLSKCTSNVNKRKRISTTWWRRFSCVYIRGLS